MIEARYDWQLKEADKVTQAAKTLSQALELEPLVAQILTNRGYPDVESASTFLSPDLNQLADPFLMFEMQTGIDRIQEAIMAGEKITIYGDYDTDGVTSTAIMYETLLQVGAEVDFFIPNRFTDGYGPNGAVFERLIKNGTGLIVTVDNGVSGHEAITKAQELGVDVVVTDHHELPENLPDAVALIHPRHPKGHYPFGELSGAGVAFKVATALLEEVPQELLDLVAIGTVADLVPLLGENRVLVNFGLRAIQNTERLGLGALIKKANIDRDGLDEQAIGFGLAPRLNALGRLDDATPAVTLLTTLDENEAEELADLTERQNKERQQLVADISQEALAKVEDADHRDHPAALIVGENWHEGVLGIVASKVVEATGKPALVLSVSDDGKTAKGSGRSVKGFDLFAAFDNHRELVLNFGGHAAAVGMTAKVANLAALQKAFDQATIDQGLANQPKTTLSIAAQLTAADVTQELYGQVRRLAPFGTDNPVPTFIIEADQIKDVKAIGADSKHLKFSVQTANETVSAIYFGQGPLADALNSADQNAVTVAAQLSVNSWQGRTSMQLMVKDLRVDGLVFEDKRTQSLRRQMFTENGVYAFFNPRIHEQLKTYLPPHATSWLLTDVNRLTDLQTKNLFLVDCPENLVDLQTAVTSIQAERLIAYFYTTQSQYLLGMPDHDQFASLFKFIKQHQNIDVAHRLAELASYLGIDLHQLALMVKIFNEVGFVQIKKGVMNPVANPRKQDLKEAPSYRAKEQQIETEQRLLYSETAELKTLIGSFMNSGKRS